MLTTVLSVSERFKFATKYVVDKLPDGDRATISYGDSVRIQSDGEFDDMLIDNALDVRCTLNGFITEDTFYATDIVSYDGEELCDRPWDERYLVLKNDFDWTHTVRLSQPIVVTGREEMEHAIDAYRYVPDSDGVRVWSYNETLPKKTDVVTFDG